MAVVVKRFHSSMETDVSSPLNNLIPSLRWPSMFKSGSETLDTSRRVGFRGSQKPFGCSEFSTAPSSGLDFEPPCVPVVFLTL